MHDIRWIRENPAAFDAAMKKRRQEPAGERLVALDQAHRAALTAMQQAQSERNDKSKQIGQAKSRGEDAAELIAAVAALKTSLQENEEKARALGEELEGLLAGFPNIPEPDVPDGDDEAANEQVRAWGEPPRRNFAARQHFELGEDLGLMDFETAAKLSGARFVILRRDLARLERALAAFMLDIHTGEFGYQEIAGPLLVREHTAYGTGNLPKFEEDLFKTTDGFYLIPTAEMMLTNLVREQILEQGDLPLRFTAHTPCFRSEAGAAGRDTRGMIRQHQFSKVELVSITDEDGSAAELDRMTACAEAILQRLDLPYRVMLLSSGDMGFSAQRTYDLEVWLPGQDTYREISSCSNCGPFQARRMSARYRVPGEKGTRLVHTLNGSGLALGRTLIAVMENYQQEDGSIAVPAPLQPYLGGQNSIGGGTA